MDRRLLALCFGNFVIGTGTLVVPGSLSAIAEGLGVTVPDAGRLIVAFAVTVCVLSPLLAGITSRFERRGLLCAMLVLFAVGHAIAYVAESYSLVLASRVVSAIAAGLFTSQAAGTAALLVPAEKRGSALAFVFLGWSIASVAGVPLAAWLSEAAGWRASFAVVAALSMFALVAVALTIPARLFVQPIDQAAWARVFTHRTLMVIVLLTAIQVWAQFTVFSYFTPMFKQQLGAGGGLVSVLLAVFGAAGILGNVVAAQSIDRIGAPRIVLLSIVLMAAGQALLWPLQGSIIGTAAGLAVWGLGCFAVNSAQQARLAAAAPALTPVSIALNTSAVYLGQAAGAETGAQVINRSSVDALPVAGLLVFAAAIALTVWLAARERQVVAR